MKKQLTIAMLVLGLVTLAACGETQRNNGSTDRKQQGIIDGEIVPQGKFKFSAGIVRRTSNEPLDELKTLISTENGLNQRFKCGATRIHKNWVLTSAGNCLLDIRGTGIVSPGTRAVWLGDHTIAGENSAGELYEVDQIIVNPTFSFASFFGDAALLHLVDVEEEPTADEILKIAPVENLTLMRDLNKVATIIGWGVTSFGSSYSRDLKQASVLLKSHDQCEDLLRPLDHRLGYDVSNFTAANTCVVAKGGTDGTSGNVCGGDGGGPLLVNYGNESNPVWTLIGIASWASENARCRPTDPVVYSNIWPLASWLQNLNGDASEIELTTIYQRYRALAVQDWDQDGIIDSIDLDDDNDGLTDEVEGLAIRDDDDVQGLPNRLDIDSDDDGGVAYGEDKPAIAFSDAHSNGLELELGTCRLIDFTDINNNGLDDRVDPAITKVNVPIVIQ